MDDAHRTQSLKELVNRFLETSPFQRQLETAMVRSTWYKVMPKIICDRTLEMYVYNNKLFLKITSSALRHELRFNKDKILDLLKEAMPHTRLQDVVLL
ncbi:DUF721 domain-containing protein [Candidatus Cardinium hertigii]|jgi:hypothetical protein|uniref:DUF721 domain-containing protein n=1 Tax=Candidatus Cardinium hertigii TaxID=247481 RepID=A0A3N2QD66_9BACT|nr:DUF721 domain-containing protein [Candidatus Cardinium hertigii]ROT47572.1 DUF721 domain-containing protein [Candidatus Cardinium hertigii]